MQNYYEVLKVPKTANAEEIKLAFRKLALIYHPDMATGNQQAFVLINEAYSVLSDKSKKMMYDLSLGGQQNSQNKVYSEAPKVNINLCQSCGADVPITKVKFHQNIGLLVTRSTKSIEGRFCKNCINKYFAQYTLITFIFGWWGIISFFVNIAFLFNNIAEFLRTSGMKIHKNTMGYQKRAWGVLLSVVTVVIICIYNISSSSADSTSGLPPRNNPAPVDQVGRLNDIPVQQPFLVVRKLDNGTILAKSSRYLKGLGELTINNGNDSAAVVKLVRVDGGSLVYKVYVAAKSSFTIEKISNGDYKVLFTVGTDWDGKKFTRDVRYKSFDEVTDFTTTEFTDSTEYSTYTLTLNAVSGGNAQTTNIDESKFEEYE